MSFPYLWRRSMVAAREVTPKEMHSTRFTLRNHHSSHIPSTPGHLDDWLSQSWSLDRGHECGGRSAQPHSQHWMADTDELQKCAGVCPSVRSCVEVNVPSVPTRRRELKLRAAYNSRTTTIHWHFEDKDSLLLTPCFYFFASLTILHTL